MFKIYRWSNVGLKIISRESECMFTSKGVAKYSSHQCLWYAVKPKCKLTPNEVATELPPHLV